MKKIVTAACAATLAVAALSSCCGKDGCSTAAGDCSMTKAQIDSVSIAQGEYIGLAVLNNFPMMQREGEVKKEDIIKGIQIAFGAPAGRGTEIGLQFGLQMMNEMKQLESMGIKVDRSVMLNRFKKAFMQDTVNQQAAQEAYASYQAIINRIQEAEQARKDAEIAASPEAQANVAAGEEYVSIRKAADPDLQTTASGVTYKIETKGDGAPVDGANRLKLKYTEKKTDGSEVTVTSEGGRTTYISNVTPGFAEGLKMLNQGGKAMFIVPGELAYGVHGVPSRQVGPNEALVYEVEVIEVN